MSLPSQAQLLTLFVEIEDDPTRRSALAAGWSLFEAVRDAGLLGADDIDGLGRIVGELVDQGLMRCGSHAGGSPPLPAGAVWNGAELQRHHDYATTAFGRADAERFVRGQGERAAAQSSAGVEPRQLDAEIFGEWFQRLAYVFDLPPGSTFPILPRSVGEDDHAFCAATSR
jgi:hypothetical protein